MELAHLSALWRCNKCGACTAVCPLYQQTVHEGMAARGKLALLEAVVDGALAPSPALRRRIEDCLLCGACAHTCPSLVPTTDLFLEARAELATRLGQALPVQTLLYALSSPRLLAAGLLWLGRLQRSGLLRVVERAPGRLVPAAVRAAVRSAPPIPRRPFSARQLPGGTDARGTRGRVAYFAGCFMNWGYAEAAEATRLSLEASGFRVECPAVLCCGVPHQAYGDAETGRRLARENIRRLEGYPAIITDCASCGAALKAYGDLLAGDPAYRGRARALSARVADVSEFLVREGLARPQRKIPIRVTYHDPCHLGRGQGVTAQPRELLRSIPGLTLVEMQGADVCCGGAGSFCVTHPDLSAKVGAAKVESILATRAEVVASGCPSCISQLRAMLRDRGVAARVCHPVELLAASLRESPEDSRSATSRA